MAAAAATVVDDEYTYCYSYFSRLEDNEKVPPLPQAAVAAKEVPSNSVASIGEVRVSSSEASSPLSQTTSSSPMHSDPSEKPASKPKEEPNQIAQVVATAPKEETNKKDANPTTSKIKNSSETAIGKTGKKENTRSNARETRVAAVVASARKQPPREKPPKSVQWSQNSLLAKRSPKKKHRAEAQAARSD